MNNIVDREAQTWMQCPIDKLWAEFDDFNDGAGIGECIDWLIQTGFTANNGRTPFHVRELRDKFYKDLANDYRLRILGK